MRMSRLFTQTLREAPAGTELPGQQFLLRAGYAAPVSAGIQAALPLAERSLQRLETACRQALALEDAQELSLPLAQPADLAPGTPFSDAAGRAMVIASDPLPALAALLPSHIRSYRQLPATLVSTGPTWQDLPRPRGGWLHGRYDRSLQVFTLCPDASTVNAAAERTILALRRLHERIQLPAHLLEDGEGARWFFPFPAGDDTALTCSECGYTASSAMARFRREDDSAEAPLPLEKVATPHCPTIDSLAQFLGVPAARTAKAVFLTAEMPGGPQLIFVVVRGDRDLSEEKLIRLLGARSLRPATDAEIQAVGAVPGYASPVGLDGAWVIVDEEIPISPNRVSGANEEGYHLLNVTYGRDYTARQVADLALAPSGAPCPRCGAALREENGVFTARIAAVSLPGCTFVDETGQTRALRLLRVELPLYRLLACLAEAHHDERGLVLPPAAAPFDVFLVMLGSKTGQPETEAAALYDRLQEAGLDVLLDDRAESPGVKFNDADLIGAPLRVTVGERSLKAGGVEMKPRAGEITVLPLAEAAEKIVQALKNQLK